VITRNKNAYFYTIYGVYRKCINARDIQHSTHLGKVRRSILLHRDEATFIYPSLPIPLSTHLGKVRRSILLHRDEATFIYPSLPIPLSTHLGKVRSFAA
jgi:hypothetical protein